MTDVAVLKRIKSLGEPKGVGVGKDAAARALGWFSLALGAAQLAAPRSVARLIGVKGGGRHSAVMRAVGVRELATGMGILARRRPAGWVWARVAGDAVDLALLAAAERKRRTRVAAAAAAVAGVTVTDVLESLRLSRDTYPSEEREDGLRVRASVTVRPPRDDVYAFWRDFENFPSFMSHVESVDVSGDHSRWTVTAPVGTVSWDARIVEERERELISWRSIVGSGVDNSGTVRFVDAPGGRGTEIHVEMRYDPPAGGLGALVAKLFGEEPEQQVKDDLRRLKQLLEAGEILVSEGNPEGRTARRMLRQKPANPSALEGAVR